MVCSHNSYIELLLLIYSCIQLTACVLWVGIRTKFLLLQISLVNYVPYHKSQCEVVTKVYVILLLNMARNSNVFDMQVSIKYLYVLD